MLKKLFNTIFKPKEYLYQLPEPTRCPPIPKCATYKVDKDLQRCTDELALTLYGKFPYASTAALDRVFGDVLVRFATGKFSDEELEQGVEAVLIKTVKDKLITGD